MTEIRHIVFDLGNVLLRWNPELPYLRLIPDPIVRKRFLADICNGDWLIQTDRGMDWPEAETVLIARHPEEAEMIRAFRKHWHEMAPGLVEGSAEILTELLDRGYDVTALTNFAADTFLEAKPRFPILDRFRGVTVSAHTGFAKPDPDIYRHHAEAFGLSPPHVLFFDDTMKNVVAAREAGWNAEQFIDAKGMRADLARYGVLVGA
jgi:2-haloacid dehalogenase